MDSVEHLTVSLPADLVRDIDRLEKSRSSFVTEAVRHELDRRRRHELRHSLQSPHRDSTDLAEQGLEEWKQSLPEEDVNELVDLGVGKPVRWGARPGLDGGARVRLGRGAVVLVALDPRTSSFLQKLNLPPGARSEDGKE